MTAARELPLCEAEQTAVDIVAFVLDQPFQRHHELPALEWRILIQTIAVRAFGCGVAACDHCGAVFLTGHRTGRRNRAKFCGVACRVAWHRAHPK